MLETFSCAGSRGEGEADVGQGERGGDPGRAQQRGNYRAAGPQVRVSNFLPRNLYCTIKKQMLDNLGYLRSKNRQILFRFLVPRSQVRVSIFYTKICIEKKTDTGQYRMFSKQKQANFVLFFVSTISG